MSPIQYVSTMQFAEFSRQGGTSYRDWNGRVVLTPRNNRLLIFLPTEDDPKIKTLQVRKLDTSQEGRVVEWLKYCTLEGKLWVQFLL